jgi:hypothetical protein
MFCKKIHKVKVWKLQKQVLKVAAALNKANGKEVFDLTISAQQMANKTQEQLEEILESISELLQSFKKSKGQ